MGILKKSLLWLLAALVAVLATVLVLQKKGYFEDPAIALRELENMGIEASSAEVRKAVQKNDWVQVKRLGRAGVNFTEADSDGHTALHVALTGDHREALPLLDQFGIEVNKPDVKGRCLLEEALDQEEFFWAEELCQRGADINFLVGNEPATLIYYEQGRTDDLAFLIKQGAEPNPTGQEGLSLLARMIKAGDVEWLNRILATGTTIEGADHALAAQALEMGRADLLISLLKAGANPDQPALGGGSLIHRLLRDRQALGFNDQEAASVLQELISRNADLEAKGPSDLRPLQATIAYTFPAGRDLLLPKVADVSGCLGLAIHHADWTAMRGLLDRGAQPDELFHGETPLFTMIKNGQVDMIKTLIDKGASLEALGAQGQRPLVTAIATGNEEVVLTLLNHERKPELSAVMEFPVSEAFRDLYDRSGLLDWYARNERELQPIMVAVILKQLKVVERLIELKVDKFSRTKHGVYPIQMAAKRGDVKMQQLLIGVPYDDEKQVRNFIIDLSEQKVYLYKGGKVIKTSRCSTGKSGNRTPTGNYVITDKSKNKTSNLYNAKMPYFQRFSCSEIGFHEGATYAGFLSHGCIRLPMSTAKYFWGQTQIGDRVTIRK